MTPIFGPPRTTVRPTSTGDLDAARSVTPFAQEDRWRPDGRSFVARERGEVVGVAMSAPDRLHPTRDILVLDVRRHRSWERIGTPLLEAIRARAPRPLTVEAAVGSDDHRFFRAAGAVAYQRRPAQRVDPRRDDVAGWCADHAGETVPGSRVPVADVVEALTRQYWWTHEQWAPMVSFDVVTELAAAEIHDDTDLARSRFTVRDGGITAACFVHVDASQPVLTGTAEAIDPRSPHARADVAACMSAVLAGLDEPFEFDGHVSDPHFAPLLDAMPGVSGDAVDLLEIPSG